MWKGLKKRVSYLGVTYVGAVAQFMLLPYFANLLGVEAFGLFAYYYAVVNWVAFLSTLGAQTQIRKSIIGFSNQNLARKYASELISLVVLLMLFTIPGFLLFLFCSAEVSIGASFSMLSYVTFYIAISIFSTILIANRKFLRSALYNTVATSLPLLVFVVIGHYYQVTWSLRFWLSAACMAAIISFNFSSIKRQIDFNTGINLRRLRRHFGESVRVTLHSLYDKILSQGDKLLVAYLFGLKALAIYALGSQISNVIHMSLKAFSVFSENSIFSHSQKKFLSCFVTGIAGLLFCLMFYTLMRFAFEYLFDADFSAVLDILLIQFLIVLVRVMATLVFTINLVASLHFRNIAVEYGTLLAGLVLAFIVGVPSLKSFCYVLLSVTVGALLFNIALSWRDSHHNRLSHT